MTYFNADYLEELGIPFNKLVVLNEEYEQHRWYTKRRIVFNNPQDNNYYEVFYLDPSTEMQDDQDCWEYIYDVIEDEFNLVEAWRVEPYDKVVIDYRRTDGL